MLRKRISAALWILTLLMSFSASATEPEKGKGEGARFLTDDWSIRLIGSLAYLDTDISAGSVLGALIDVEDVLGFDEDMTAVNFDTRFRFTKNRKHALRFAFIGLDRRASAQLEGTVPILDVEFVGGIDSEFDNRVYSLGYEYSFVNNGTTEAGFLAGLATYSYRLAIEGQIVVDDTPDLTRFASEQTSVLAPVPNVGIFVYHALTPQLVLELRTAFIDLEIGEHNGRVFNSLANLTWYFSDHFGVGLGFGATDITYEQERKGKRLKVDYAESTIDLSLAFVF